MFNEISQIKGLQLEKPEGAFYAFISIKALLSEKFPSSLVWSSQLLKDYQIAVVPGEAFLAPGYIRLSYAASMTELKQAMTGIKNFIESP